MMMLTVERCALTQRRSVTQRYYAYSNAAAGAAGRAGAGAVLTVSALPGRAGERRRIQYAEIPRANVNRI